MSTKDAAPKRAAPPRFVEVEGERVEMISRQPDRSTWWGRVTGTWHDRTDDLSEFVSQHLRAVRVVAVWGTVFGLGWVMLRTSPFVRQRGRSLFESSVGKRLVRRGRTLRGQVVHVPRRRLALGAGAATTRVASARRAATVAQRERAVDASAFQSRGKHAQRQEKREQPGLVKNADHDETGVPHASREQVDLYFYHMPLMRSVVWFDSFKRTVKLDRDCVPVRLAGVVVSPSLDGSNALAELVDTDKAVFVKLLAADPEQGVVDGIVSTALVPGFSGVRGNVNLSLLKRGWARVCEHPRGGVDAGLQALQSRYRWMLLRFEKAEAQAKARRKGMWADLPQGTLRQVSSLVGSLAQLLWRKLRGSDQPPNTS